MKNFFAFASGIFFFLQCISLSAQTHDASTFISKSKTSKLPSMLRQSVQTFTVDAVMADKIFGSYAQTLTLDNFPTSSNTNQTIQVSAVPSTIDAKTIIMIGNRQVPVPTITSYE
ncbi:MAG: hypothetical protein ACO30M_06735, partial [Candidatus Kapaibacteriota bacterium]